MWPSECHSNSTWPVLMSISSAIESISARPRGPPSGRMFQRTGRYAVISAAPCGVTRNSWMSAGYPFPPLTVAITR